MKSLIIAGAAAVVVAGAFSPVLAYTLSPAGATFWAAGPLTVTVATFQELCNTELKVDVHKNGVGGVVFVNFRKGESSRPFPVDLPWKFKATGNGKGKILGVAFTAFGATCGPSTIPVQISGAGVITFNNVSLAGGCMLNGSMNTTPPITTVP
jgi:hypothetical protein